MRDFPTKSDAWREVDKLGLLVRINDASLQARIRFNALAEHYLKADFVFSSFRAEGKVPLSAGVFVADYLRPAAIAAGVSIENGQRFGLHNLRHSLSNWLVNKAKVEPKTVQGILQTTLRAGLWVVTIGCHSF
ncbi:MAG TPA: hypothetical protein VK638_53270 [Edaphobacter sp.]|nr:hypothetical protein [Edaphobacter sp.]